MTTYAFDEFPSSSSVAAGVTLLASAWFLVAGATMIGSPTDTQIARASSVSVKPLGVMPSPQPPSMAIAPEARLTIVVSAHRA